MKAVIKIHQHVTVSHGAPDLFFYSFLAQDALGAENFAGTKPSFKEVKEVNTVFYKDASAIVWIPKPVIRWQTFTAKWSCQNRVSFSCRGRWVTIIRSTHHATTCGGCNTSVSSL